MKISFWPTTAQSWPDLLRGCRWAEAKGWDGIWVPDHFMANVAPGDPDPAEEAPWLEAWTTQAALAALVPRVRIGSMVAGNLYRHPAVVANAVGTVDEISGGRAVLGLGAGWQANEHARYGIELGSPGERSDRFEEACEIVRRLLDETRTTFRGEHYRLDAAPCEPSGHDGHRIPLLVGGKGERRTLRTVARHADEWNMWALPDEIAPKRDVIARWCDEIERDPAEIRVTTAVMGRLCRDDAEADTLRDLLGNHAGLVGGSAEELHQRVGDYVEAGVEELVIADFNLGLHEREHELGRLQEDVLDHFR